MDGMENARTTMMGKCWIKVCIETFESLTVACGNQERKRKFSSEK